MGKLLEISLYFINVAGKVCEEFMMFDNGFAPSIRRPQIDRNHCPLAELALLLDAAVHRLLHLGPAWVVPGLTATGSAGTTASAAWWPTRG